MAESEILSITEPREFTAAIRDADVELSLLAPGSFTASMTRVCLRSLKMARISESHP